jgi:hypothetical protein
MAPNLDPSDARTTTVPLLASHRAPLELVRALDALTDVGWLGSAEAGPADHPDWRRVGTILALPVADGSAPGPVRKGALVDIGPPTASTEEVVVDVGWQSDSMAPLFPVFAGRLRITPAGLFLEGRYAPPFGRLGLLIDERLLHFIAQRTAQAFLDRLADRIAG